MISIATNKNATACYNAFMNRCNNKPRLLNYRIELLKENINLDITVISYMAYDATYHTHVLFRDIDNPAFILQGYADMLHDGCVVYSVGHIISCLSGYDLEIHKANGKAYNKTVVDMIEAKAYVEGNAPVYADVNAVGHAVRKMRAVPLLTIVDSKEIFTHGSEARYYTEWAEKLYNYNDMLDDVIYAITEKVKKLNGNAAALGCVEFKPHDGVRIVTLRDDGSVACASNCPKFTSDAQEADCAEEVTANTTTEGIIRNIEKVVEGLKGRIELAEEAVGNLNEARKSYIEKKNSLNALIENTKQELCEVDRNMSELDSQARELQELIRTHKVTINSCSFTLKQLQADENADDEA